MTEHEHVYWWREIEGGIDAWVCDCGEVDPS